MVLVNLRPARTEPEIVSQLEQLARDWVDPAAKL
jgi:hypothetical protein